MFKRIDTVFVYVTNIHKAADWYKKILGLSVVLDYPEYITFSLGETQLTLIENSDKQNSKFSAFNFYVEDAQACHNYLINKGVQVTNIINDGVAHFAFYDEDGNRLEVCSF